jgi:cobalt-zinc-cadmium efflux system outer membrane protein
MKGVLMKVMAHHLLVLALLFPSTLLGEKAGEGGPGAAEWAEPLSLEKVFRLVLEGNPRLKAGDYELGALGGRKLQAGRRPNPEFATILENFGGTNGIGFGQSAEATFSLTQKFELGGKRKLRVRAVEAEEKVALQELALLRAQLLAVAAENFARILAAQEQCKNRQELLDLAIRTDSIVRERVTAGKVSPIEQSRSAVTLETARLEAEQAEKEQIAAKESLAGLWGGHGDDFLKVSGAFHLSRAMEQISSLPPLISSPEVKRAAALLDFQRALLEVDSASRKPDIALGGGWRRLNQYGGSAWVATLSLPLPLLDRKQGAITEAQNRISKSVQQQKAVEQMVLANWLETRRVAEAAYLEATSLRTSILPSAQSAFSSLEEGYRLGKFEYLQVLDAQRTFFSLKAREIDAALKVCTALIRMNLLTGSIQAEEITLSLLSDKESAHEK